MEVAVAEEKKKIFRARKTMKFSDRQQLDSLHATLLTASPPPPPPSSANPSPPPLVNGVHHKEDGGSKGGPGREHNNNNNASAVASPDSSRGSPDLSLSLVLSPSPPATASAAAVEDTPPPPASPASPFHSLNFELKKMEEKDGGEEEKERRTEALPTAKDAPALNGDCGGGKEEPAPVAPKMADDKGEAPHATAEEAPSGSPEERGWPVAAHSEPMETDSGPEENKPSDQGDAGEKPPSSPTTSCSSKEQEVKEEEEEEEKAAVAAGGEGSVKEEEGGDGGDGVRKGSSKADKMEVDHVKVEKMKMAPTKMEVVRPGKSSRPSSTPPSDTAVQEKSSTSGVKRTLSEGDDEGTPKDKREGKKPKVEGVELEAQLELKITAKGGSRIKLEKVVQQLVEEQLRALQLSVMDKSLQELKEKVDAIDCATKHQTALKTLQAKIVRLVKKFGTANQVSENKRKQEALAAAAAASATAAKNVAAAAVTQQQRLVRTSFEVKQTPTTLSPTVTTATAPAPPASSAVVTQAPILQIITSSSSPSTTLAQAISTQSPTGTLLFKTATGGNVMTPGQPLLIQLPLSMTNGQTGTLVKFPVTSFASGGLGKAKTTAPTATFILKTAPAITTTAATLSGPVTATVPALQASGGGGQMSPAQISLARAMGQGGAGVSATAVGRAPAAQLVSVAGTTMMMTTTLAAASSSSTSLSSSSVTVSQASAGLATPGPLQSTSVPSKSDNPVTTPAKTPVAARPKGSVIDLTEDDDDVLVTGVKKATVTPSSTTQRSMVTMPTSSGLKSTQGAGSNPQLTVHHRPPLDSPVKSRPGAPSSSSTSAPSSSSSTTTTTTTTTSNSSARPSAVSLPALPGVPAVRLPPEAAQSSAPQQPQLKLVPSQTGIVLSWCVAETDRSCAPVDTYHLYAFHQDNSSSSGGTASQHWKKIGEVKALPLPMACTLTQFQSGSTYHFAVRARDIYGRFGPFCEPQCTNVITSSAS